MRHGILAERLRVFSMQGQRLTEVPRQYSSVIIVVVARFFDGTRMKGVDEAIQRDTEL